MGCFFLNAVVYKASDISNMLTEFVKTKSESLVVVNWQRVVTKQYLKSQAVVISATIGSANGEVLQLSSIV